LQLIKDQIKRYHIFCLIVHTHTPISSNKQSCVFFFWHISLFRCFENKTDLVF